MKAILMNGYGGPEVLQYGDAPDPLAGPGEIVVDIHAASLNPSDWKSREGHHGSDPKMPFPHILGRDFQVWCEKRVRAPENSPRETPYLAFWIKGMKAPMPRFSP
jgi:hypothetical protein